MLSKIYHSKTQGNYHCDCTSLVMFWDINTQCSLKSILVGQKQYLSGLSDFCQMVKGTFDELVKHILNII